jgi:hypothetical protein
MTSFIQIEREENHMTQQIALNCPKLPTPADSKPPLIPQDQLAAGLSDRQMIAMDMIVSGATDTAVAAALNVGRRTVYSWRVENERFKEVLRYRRREMYDKTVDRFRDMLGTALDRLEKQVSDPYAPTSLRAARTLLALARVGQAVASEPKIEKTKSKAA